MKVDALKTAKADEHCRLLPSVFSAEKKKEQKIELLVHIMYILLSYHISVRACITLYMSHGLVTAKNTIVKLFKALFVLLHDCFVLT